MGFNHSRKDINSSCVEISVVMPTYNTPVPVLREAVESILNQTYSNFEFIIINDCSTDGSAEYLESLSDPRIVLINNPTNLGVTKSLNIGLDAARGKYIARMDSDDISLPNRFEKQLAFLKKHPDVMVCGTNYENFGLINSQSDKGQITDTETIRISLLFSATLCHPTVMINRKMLLSHQIRYNEQDQYAQDYEMWVDVSKVGKMAIMRDVLLRKRCIEISASMKHRDIQVAVNRKLQKRQLEDLMDDVTDSDLDLHFAISYLYEYDDFQISKNVLEWVDRLIMSNRKRKCYKKRQFSVAVYTNLIRVLLHSIKKEKGYRDKFKLLIIYFPKSIYGIEALLKAAKKRIKRSLREKCV